jgi:hypothetical protein
VLSSTITNTTSAAIYLSSGSLTDSTDFTQVDNCGGLIAATSGSCTVNFTFTPKSVAALSSSYAIHDLNNPGSPLTVELTGTGTAAPVPQALLTPGSVTFTTVAGTAAANQTLTLSNPGTGALTISGVALSGTNAASFSVVSSGCTGTLGAGASCTIVVGCSAATYGSYTATLTVTDNATPTTQSSLLSCNVSGTGQATLTPASLSFGSVVVGSTTGAQAVTLSNPGTAALTITSVGLTGTNAANFAIAANTCGATLAAGAACSVGVTFAPTAAGSATAALSVVDSAGTQTSALSGTGSAVTPPDFTMSVAGTQPIAFGFVTGSIDLTLHLASLSTSTPFNNAVSLSATGLPAGTTYTFTPATATPGAAGANVDVLIQLPDSVRVNLGHGPAPWRKSPEVVTLAGLVLAVLWRKRRVGIPSLLAVVLLSVFAMTAGTGCDQEGFAEYTLPGDKGTVTISGASGTTTHTVAVQVVTTH